ncbi:hypothetical protein RclHR1_06350005 [Rhizophagus clarus]|uniref:Uncharacterized protein n=1 Tax=Rhizophagus clarus TaxID=94130 RepID=A0A2Z6RTV1_9GLOM|nr:hypothetical protein RclHR1_06350005 [Rhizophagus clarus]GES78144.1 hypothetical protein RCL_jg29630.t1 [Rhizophagus clarus]
MEPYLSTSEASALQLRLAKEEMTGVLKHQTKVLLCDLLLKLPHLCEGITVATAGAAELFDNFADYRIDLGLLQHKPKAFTQQIVAANTLGTLCHLSSAAFLDTVIFPILNQLSREMEIQIAAINNSHQSDTEAATNKGKSVYIDPPDDSSKMDINMKTTHQSKDVLSTSSPPSPPITVEQPDSWTKALTKN